MCEIDETIHPCNGCEDFNPLNGECKSNGGCGQGRYIDRNAFIADKRKQYCADCDRRKGMKNGKVVFCYEIGEAPCRACYVDDLLTDVEDYPAADVVEALEK